MIYAYEKEMTFSIIQRKLSSSYTVMPSRLSKCKCMFLFFKIYHVKDWLFHLRINYVVIYLMNERKSESKQEREVTRATVQVS